MRNFFKRKALNFIEKSEGKPLREQIILSRFSRRMLDRGIDPLLVTKGRHIATKNGLNAGLAFLSLLGRLHAGDHSVVPKITQRLASDGGYQLLLNAYPDFVDKLNDNPDLIKKEIAQTGDSPVFKWLIDKGQIEFDDPRLRDYVKARIDWFQKKHTKGYQSRDIKFDRPKALDALLELKAIFDKYDQRFFLSSGTLLGAVRENGFIATDYDIDVGVFSEEIDAGECEKMLDEGDFHIQFVKPDLIAFIHNPSQISMEIFFHDLRYNLRRCQTDVHSWWYKPFDMVPHDFQGHEFLIPSDVENHLSENFGNWKTPVLFYDFSYDCPNRTYNHSLEGILYLFDRMNRAYAKGWRYFADRPAFAMRDYFDIDYTQFVPQICNPKAIPVPLNEHRFKGAKTVLAVGLFDSFDKQQIDLLRDASEQADYLVVALPGDNLAAGSGGQEPRLNASDRAHILRALRFIDNVTLLESDEELQALVHRIQPSNIICDDEFPLNIPKNDSKALLDTATDHAKPEAASRAG